MFKTGKRFSFTGAGTVEMVVILFVAGAILSILVPMVIHRQAQRDLVSCQYNLRALASALENYKQDQREGNEDPGGYPGELNLLFDHQPPYLQSEPLCPSQRTSYGYLVNQDRTSYTLYCTCGHSSTGKDPGPGYPQYSSTSGFSSGSSGN